MRINFKLNTYNRTTYKKIKEVRREWEGRGK